MKYINKPEMCRSQSWLCATHGSPAGEGPRFWAMFTVPLEAVYKVVFFQSRSQIL